MLKKIILIILLSTKICEAEEVENIRSTKKPNTSFEVIGIGLAAYFVYTIIPKIETLDNSFGKNLAPAAGAAIGLYGASKLYNIARDVYEKNAPSEENKARINQARQENALFAARKEFRGCLMRNINAERNDLGRPIGCEDLASLFAKIAGKSELDEMTKTFNEFYRN